MVTHLFNAMSQIGNREPGLAGAALDTGTLCGRADRRRHPCRYRDHGIALRAKKGPARIFLVTDAMATIGAGMTIVQLNGRLIKRQNGRLTLEDGTLAGADLDMISAVRFMHRTIGLELGEALRMASLYPAQAVGQDQRIGQLKIGRRADIIALSAGLDVEGCGSAAKGFLPPRDRGTRLSLA